MTPVSITYSEAGMMVPVSDNRQELHGKVYTAVSDARSKRGDRDYIYSARTHRNLGSTALVTIRSQALPSSIPSADKGMSFVSGQAIQCMADLVTSVQLSQTRYKYRELEPYELQGWVEGLADRHGFRLLSASWSDRQSHTVKRAGARFFIPTSTFRMTLEVADPVKAASAWLNGIGRKKGYGFGMLEVLDG